MGAMSRGGRVGGVKGRDQGTLGLGWPGSGKAVQSDHTLTTGYMRQYPLGRGEGGLAFVVKSTTQTIQVLLPPPPSLSLPALLAT